MLSWLGNIDPAEHYAHLPALAKWMLALLMMTGRLEIFTVWILLKRVFWRH